MRYFIHYFEDGWYHWSESGGTRIGREAKPYVDKVITYRKGDLGSEFVEKYKKHFAHSRGAGYWIWKPKIIQLTLQKMDENDELLYLDTGCEIRADPKPLFELLKEQDIVTFEIDHIDRKWCKRDLFNAMQADQPEILESPQRCTTYILLRKNAKTIAIIDEWAKWAANLHLIDDSPSEQPNYWDFVEHRHDQSIWSILTKQKGYKAYPDPGWPLDKAKIVAASRRVD